MRIAVLLFAVLLPCGLLAQTSHDYSVDLSAAVQVSPAQITLNWTTGGSGTAYSVYKRTWPSANWGTPVANLGNVLTWTDTNVSVGVMYEYAVGRTGGAYTSWGFITAAIEAPFKESRGRLILIVDDTHITALATELARLEQDLVGDGWQVVRHDVSPSATVVSIKALIVAAYNTSPATTKAVFLFGNIAVPHSGNMNPDAHPDHMGAWPADSFYGDVNGGWTDSSVNNTSSANPRNHNIPGDGRYDQSIVPSASELMVGRVDLSEMPAFATSEQELLRNYLNKDHEFRTAQWRPQDRALVDDNFSAASYPEAFAASGWRSFAPMVGASNVTAADFLTSTGAGSYLWAYGCGGGTYTSAGGIGNTANFAATAIQVPFTCLFGSYHGDWDYVNAFMRAPLASGRGLTCAWSGRPHWYFHSMALGEPIGESLLYTQNRPALNTSSNGGVHVNLMGDPTLRLHYVAPATAPAAVQAGTSVQLSWTGSTDVVTGYHVYRAAALGGPYARLTTAPVAGTSYDDTSPPAGALWYMIRALALQQTASGSYYNLATGALIDITVTGQPPTITADPSDQTAPEGATATFTVSATGSGTLSYQWQQGGADIIGANSTSYTTPTLTLADNGAQFRCVVSNAFGSTTSAVATLTIGNAGGGGGGGGKGSDDGGGCSTLRGGVWTVPLAVMLLVLWRRRRRVAG
ncbi:MAG: immunoglobulin domain-containing protein [Planctomycetes bacterium]|nr:immunoglobulin domain-containing protein [Planctomycetota bacterium]